MLKVLYEQESADCTRCPLHVGRNMVVGPMSGEEARVFVVGESPGEEEDLYGKPFKSREGIYLRSLFKEAGFSDSELHFTLSVKCLGSYKSGVDQCKHWLWDEIKAVDPFVIITLGDKVTHQLLRNKKSEGLSGVVGRFHSVDYISCFIAPWYHPAFLWNHGLKLKKDTLSFFSLVKDHVRNRRYGS